MTASVNRSNFHWGELQVEVCLHAQRCTILFYRGFLQHPLCTLFKTQTKRAKLLNHPTSLRTVALLCNNPWHQHWHTYVQFVLYSCEILLTRTVITDCDSIYHHSQLHWLYCTHGLALTASHVLWKVGEGGAFVLRWSTNVWVWHSCRLDLSGDSAQDDLFCGFFLKLCKTFWGCSKKNYSFSCISLFCHFVFFTVFFLPFQLPTLMQWNIFIW